VRLQVVADQPGSKHTGEFRNRGKAGQPVSRSRRPIVEGMEMRTFGEEHVLSGGRVGHPLSCSRELRMAARLRDLCPFALPDAPRPAP
jgi:hypothetical protein